MIEIIGAICTLICVYLITRSNIWSWPVGIIGYVAYLFIFADQHLYAQMLLQTVFILQSFFGWYYWYKNKDAKPRTLKPETLIGHLFALAIGSIIFSSILAVRTDNPQPGLDVITTLLSLQGTWYLSRKIRLGWLVFIFADMLYVGMFLNQKLYYSAALYVVLEFLAIRGYMLWKKNTKMGLS